MKILGLTPNYNYYQDLFSELHKRGIECVVATSHDIKKDSQLSYFKLHNTVLIDARDFYHHDRLTKKLPSSAPALDRTILNYFEQAERDYYSITDRFAYFPLSFRERKRLYRASIKYWLGFFAENKLDAVFSFGTPHNMPDFVCFHAAKYLGIKVVIINDVMINDHINLIDDYRSNDKVPEDYLAGKSDAEIIQTIRPILYQKAFEESNHIKYSKIFNDKSLNLSNLNVKATKPPVTQTISEFAVRAGKSLKRGVLNFNKPAFKSSFAMNKNYTKSTLRILRVISGFRLKKLGKAYESLARVPDYSRKYVYFAMHLSPERTTLPEAEIFEDHVLAVHILSAAIPKDWVVYVKENPTQYHRSRNIYTGKHFRNKQDYLNMLRLPNVRLITQNVKSTDIINNAQFVSSLKGTVGLESIFAGKGCMTFANTWYNACRSAYRVHDVDSCRKAIAEILKKKPPEVATDYLKFLSYMQDHIHVGNMGADFTIKNAGMPYEQHLNMLTDEVERTIKGYNTSEANDFISRTSPPQA